jgi:pimeloyl-ACP methyl ester carboxylesterase
MIERRTIEANGLAVAYGVAGEGPPLVLLHGASSSGGDGFRAQVPRFTRAFRCYLPDARGHGGTRWDVGAGFSYSILVDDLAALLDALGLERAHLLGVSMGAQTALGLAIRSPDRVASLVLVGLSVATEPRRSVVRRLLDVERIERDDPRFAAELARRHDPVQGPGAWRSLLRALAAAIDREAPPGPAEIRRAAVPALVAVGDRDPIAPVDQAWALARQLPDARLLVLPAAGHEVHAQRAGLFNAACEWFWRAIGAIEGGSVPPPAATWDT